MTGGQRATSQQNPTDETGAEIKHAVGNARDDEKRGETRRDPTAGERDPTKQAGKTRHEMKTRNAGKTKANERKRESDTTR